MNIILILYYHCFYPCLSQIKVCYEKVSQCGWPMEATSEFIRKLPDGSVLVRSIEGHASLTLMPHQQAFTVKFLGEVTPQYKDSTSRMQVRLTVT